MSWIQGKHAVATRAAAKGESAERHNGPHISCELQDRLSAFLIAHERLASHKGRPLMHLLGVSPNHHDGSIDYAVRSRVHDDHGPGRRFDSTVRVFATGRMRLIR
ncbi:MAG TPA: hypothetical protein VIK27_07415 [Candidatus Aquilonibacter sp.]